LPAQLEMLRRPDGTLPAGAIQIARGRGRPPGAKNKRSKRIADYYVQRYGDPLDALGQLANTPLRQLIEVLMEADGSAEREARLLEGVDQAVDAYECSAAIPGRRTSAKWPRSSPTRSTSWPMRRAGSAGSRASSRSTRWRCSCRRTRGGDLRPRQAADQRRPAQVRRRRAGRAGDAQGAHGIDPQALADAIATRGLEAFDPDSLRLIEDGEFSEAEGNSRHPCGAENGPRCPQSKINPATILCDVCTGKA
jgi:hypothetical protein